MRMLGIQQWFRRGDRAVSEGGIEPEGGTEPEGGVKHSFGIPEWENNWQKN